MASLSDIVRLEDPSFYWDNPYPVLQRMRQEDPVFYYEPLDMWVMSKYEDIRHVGLTPEVFSNTGGLFFSDFRYGHATKSLFFHADAENMGFMDPPRHNDIRRIAMSAFTPKILNGMREGIRKVVLDLIGPIKAGEPVNWSHQIAEPLPLLVIAILMGLPIEAYDKLKFYSDEIIKVGLDATPEENDEISARLASSDEYFEKLLVMRDHAPTDDLMGTIQEARRSGQISTASALTMIRGVVTAGNETTRNTLNGGIIALCQNPGQLELLATQPDLVRGTTEEFLRYVSPVRGFGRTVLRDTEVRGRKIKAGQRVLNFFMSGNRDEDAFDNPEVFDLARPRKNPNVAMGIGQHFCIGAAVARLEICILLEELIKRFSRVELVGAPDTDMRQLNFYGWENVQVVFS